MVSGRLLRLQGRGRGALAVLVSLALLGGAGAFSGCSLHQEGVHPPDNRIFFPGGGVIESAGPGLGRWLYVVNSNSDLRYNAGTVVAVDLQAVRLDYQDPDGKPAVAPDGMPWRQCLDADSSFADTRFVPGANVLPNHQCCWDYLDPKILNCDEQKYILRDRTIRTGNFGGRPVLQQLHDQSIPGRHRMFLPVRGDVAIGMIEIAPQNADDVQFLCTGPRSMPTNPQTKFASCDPNWRITRTDDPLNNPGAIDLPADEIEQLPDEPYALAVDDDLEVLYVGHLRGGGVSMIDLGSGQSELTPRLLQVYGGLLPPDANGSQGVTSLTIKNRSTCRGPVYVTSRYNPLVGSFVVYGLDNCDPAARTDAQGARGITIVGTGQVLSTGLMGAETRGIEFVGTGTDSAGIAHDPDRAFILQRTPPALVAVDTVAQVPFATIEVCQSPTNLVQQKDDNGRAVALFVTCFDAGEVYVIDPWTPRVRAVIPIGRGPITTILPPEGAQAADTNRAYVIGFGANNVAVIDLDPLSPTQYRVIQRIGFASPTPREVGPQ